MLASLLVLCLAPSASCLSAALPLAAMSKATISDTGETSISAVPSSKLPEYINYTPKPEPAPVKEQLSLDDIAIGMISGFPHSRALQEAVLKYAPKSAILHSSGGKCACSFRFGIKKLKETYPEAKWYYVGDDDAFIHLDNLVETLSAYDSSAKVVVAVSAFYKLRRCDASAIGGGVRTFYGGTGHILSAGLVHSAEYSEILGQPCDPPRLTGADVEHTCSVLPLWTPDHSFIDLGLKTTQRGLNGQNQFMASPPDFLVAHHLSPSQIASFAKFNQHLPARHPTARRLYLPDERCITVPS